MLGFSGAVPWLWGRGPQKGARDRVGFSPQAGVLREEKGRGLRGRQDGAGLPIFGGS